MNGLRLMDSSVQSSVQSIQETPIKMRPMDTSNYLTDQLFMTSGLLVVWTMLIALGLFVSLISILLVYRSRQRRIKSLNPLDGIGANYNGQESGYSGETTPPNVSSVNIGSLAPVTRRIKVSSSYASLTSDSSSEEEFPEGRRKSQISMTQELTIGPKGTVRTFPVQPMAREGAGRGSISSRGALTSHHQRSNQTCRGPGTSVATGTENNPTEKRPQLTISMSTSNDSNLVKLTLIKCDHLKRSIEPKESTFRRVVRSRGMSSGFTPQGIIARIYRLSDIKCNPHLSRNSSNSSSAVPSNSCPTNGKTSRSASTESESSITSSPKSATPLLETPLIKSRKGPFVKFNEEDSLQVNVEDFPLRVSLYEIDKNKVKSPLGHSIVDNISTLNVTPLSQIVLNVRLYETVFDAIRANHEQSKD